ncbi:hypothetical protein D1AOALGA4SA_10386 [Olavius algarvensis Delta 1 endosymbiont]|nr:hypothetical protein D1AOALGA4SA_10386 [Olavius algarvensis Delta 1 endosymbiont]
MGVCNLECRFCPQGQNINHQPKKRLSLSGFKKLSESVLPYAKKITFSNWSEPFLNREWTHKRKNSHYISMIR